MVSIASTSGLDAPVGAPLTITVHGICEEPGLNGVYERNGNFRDGKPQWMKPGSRCYIRWIRDRWEIYVSHHPAGTTYFVQSENTELPMTHGWRPSEVMLPSECATLTYSIESSIDEQATASDRASAERPVVSPDDTLPLVLWCNDTCPFVQRVSIALREKGLKAQMRKVDLFGDRDPAFLSAFTRACPHRGRRSAIPVLEVRPDERGGTHQLEASILIDSKVIVAYLDEAFDTAPQLMPSGATARARVRLFVDAFEHAVGPCESAALNATNAAALVAASEQLVDGLGAVDRALQMYAVGDREGGAFLCGDLFSMAEVLCAPQLQRLVTLLPHFRSQLKLSSGAPLDIMAQRFPRLHAWTDAVLSRPSVSGTYDFAAVVAVKSKAVATFQDEDMAKSSRQETRASSAAMLEGLLKARIATAPALAAKNTEEVSGYYLQAAPIALIP